jgi:hypothetical protein
MDTKYTHTCPIAIAAGAVAVGTVEVRMGGFLAIVVR